jgi:hypothetical protein
VWVAAISTLSLLHSESGLLLIDLDAKVGDGGVVKDLLKSGTNVFSFVMVPLTKRIFFSGVR